MAARNIGPRSVADATRFTSSTPHANTKSTPAAGRSSSSSHVSSSLPRRGAGGGSSIPQETMEERVRRLRAAHLAAKQHNLSRMDQIIGGSRRLFDAAHKFTVMGLIGFSGIALLVTAYATVDMMTYNRKRRAEFFALQKQLREDSLEAARLAYMTGTASEEQIALVEETLAKAKEAGMTLPSILSAPQSAAVEGHNNNNTVSSHDEDETQNKKGGITAWLFRGLKTEEAAPADDRETLSSSDDRWRTTPATADALRDKAKAAFEQERDAQRRGGPLDQIGLEAGDGKKKG